MSFDTAGVLTISVSSARWASDLAPHLETLRERVGALSGERVSSIVFRIDPHENEPRR